MRALPHGTVTFVFSDVESSTELSRSLGAAYGAALSASRRLLRDAIADHNGVEVDTQGDGLFAAFERARDAVHAAAAAQRSHAGQDWPGGSDLRIRMGLHTAEPEVWEEGYTGVGLTRAARICAAGHGGQVLLSRSTAGIVADESFEGLGLRALGRHTLKGLVWAEEVFQLVIEGLPEDFPPLATPEGAGPALETATVLIADIEKLTPLTETVIPDEFRALIAQYHQLAEAVLEECDGFSRVSFADSNTAIFRSPRSAIRAAVELHRRLGERTWPAGVRLRVRIGVHSGQLVTTAYGPLGHPVNTCSQICAAARGGQALVSEVTRGLLRDSDLTGAALADAGELEIQGATMRVYEIVEGAPKA